MHTLAQVVVLKQLSLALCLTIRSADCFPNMMNTTDPLPTISSSKARRLRNAETKRQLYVQCQQVYDTSQSTVLADHTANIVSMLTTVLQRLDGLSIGQIQDY